MLTTSLTIAQQPKIILNSDHCDYFLIEGESGEKFYNKVQSINDFKIEDFYAMLDNPNRKLTDFRIQRSSTELVQFEIYEDSISGFNPLTKNTARPGYNIQEFSYKDGIIRFQSTQDYITNKGETKSVTIYTYINPGVKMHPVKGQVFSIYMFEFFKYSDKTIGGNMTYVNDITKTYYNL